MIGDRGLAARGNRDVLGSTFGVLGGESIFLISWQLDFSQDEGSGCDGSLIEDVVRCIVPEIIRLMGVSDGKSGDDGDVVMDMPSEILERGVVSCCKMDIFLGLIVVVESNPQ